MRSSLRHSSFRRHAGFSLTEVLIVIGIICVLATITIRSTSGLTDSKELNRALQTVTRTMSLARQQSMSKGVPVALVLTRPADLEADKKAFQGMMVLEGSLSANGTSTTWKPTSNWEPLPRQVQTEVFERNGNKSFYASTSGGALQGRLPVELNGAEVVDYSYVIFRPDGTVDAPETGPSLSISRLHNQRDTEDYIVLVQENTGRSKVIDL
jgi:prepilin-type N-terminal cleavage/methylation domain-containing protein